jgi:hypothetical protein
VSGSNPMTEPRGTISFTHLYATCPMWICPHVYKGVFPVTCYYTCHTCHVLYSCITLPRQSYGRAMCHPCSGGTCHNITGQRVTINCQVSANAPCHVSCMAIWPVQSANMSALYRLYNQHFFYMFGKMNRS